jgi:hypothetical protein
MILLSLFRTQLIFCILCFEQPVKSKWISSSCEIIAFRKALLNPVTSRQFQRFVALKGDFLENGVLFWQEVQKYKVLYRELEKTAFFEKEKNDRFFTVIS